MGSKGEKTRYEISGKDVLELIESIWKEHPNMRFGQLLENYVFTEGERGDKTSCKLFYQEDGKTINKIKKELKNPKFYINTN